MSEYIEREKAQNGLDNIDWYHVNDKGQLLPGGKSDIETYVPFKAVEKMLQSIPTADVQPRWIPVSERLPEDLKFVLAVEDGTVFMAHCEHYYGEEEVYVEWHDTMYYPVSPTHWMPLPEPPKEVLTGTDMRGGIRRDDAGNVIDWGITGPPGDVGKTEEE